MMPIRLNKLSALLVFLALACSDKKPTDEELLAKAKNLHLEVLATKKEVSALLAAIPTDTLTVTVSKDSIAAWTEAFISWKALLVEVPGMGHEHHDHSDPDFEHLTIPNLTPEQHLDVQQELLSSIKALKSRINVYDEHSKTK